LVRKVHSAIPELYVANRRPSSIFAGIFVSRCTTHQSIEAVTSAHIVDTGLALLERSPAVSRRVDERQCGIVCATTNPEDGRLVALATIGAVGGAEDSLLECI
jgi:carbonic anhydrase